MPDLKISQLPVASATTGAELFPVVQGGVTKQIALNAVRHIGSAVFDANGSMAVDTNTLFVDAANNRVGVGTTGPAYPFHVFRSNAGVAMQVENSTTYAHLRLQSAGTNQSAYLTFNTTGTGAAIVQVNDTDRLTLDTSGNLGLGVTPSAWGIGKAIEVGSTGNAIWGVQAADMRLLANARYDGTQFVYVHSGLPAAEFRVNNDQLGGYAWRTAPSGTAGAAISFVQAMTLDASGVLSLANTGTVLLPTIINAGDPNTGLYFPAADVLAVATGGRQVARFGASSTPVFTVGSISDVGQIGTDYATVGAWGENGGGLVMRRGTGAGTAIGYVYGDSTGVSVGVSVASPLMLVTNNTERARIPAAGGMVVGTAALATTATDGFLYVPTCAGTPTGVPTTQTGTAAIVINTTNNKLYFYSGGAWRDAGP